MGWFNRPAGKPIVPGTLSGSGQAKPVGGGVKPREARQEQEAWVVQIEHVILRLVSLGFSFASAYAIALVFVPRSGDVLRLIVDFVIAGGFGVLGYFLSRNIAYRLMNGEVIWAYVPICLVVEFVEIFCNYVIGVSEVPHALWLHSVPPSQQGLVSNLAYWVLSIIPVVTLFLAVADMDIERRKRQPKASPKQSAAGVSYQQGYQGVPAGPRAPSPQPVQLGQPGVQRPQPPRAPGNGVSPAPGVQVIP